MLNTLKDFIEKEIEADNLKGRTATFRSDLLESLAAEKFFDESWTPKEDRVFREMKKEDQIIPPILIDIVKNLKCTDYSIECADYHVSSNIVVDFGSFSVSRSYNGDDEGSGRIDFTICGGKHRVMSREDSYFLKSDLSKIFGAISSELPGVTIEHFRKFVGSVFAEDYEF